MVERIVQALVIADKKVLVAQLTEKGRTNFGGAKVVFVGGNFKYGESSGEAAERAVLDKTGIPVKAQRTVFEYDLPLDDSKHLVFVECTAQYIPSIASVDDEIEAIKFIEFDELIVEMPWLSTAVYLFLLKKLVPQNEQVSEKYYREEWLNQDFGKFGEKIRTGELVCFPTETVYGIGADAMNATAVAKIFTAKGRPADNPLIVHVPSVAKISLVAEAITPTEANLFKKFSPGPLTVLLKKKVEIPGIVTAGSPLVGVRIPNHAFALEFLQAAGTPVAAPSANISGKPSATHHSHVMDAFGVTVPNVILAGKTTYGVESTVVMARNENEIVVLRQGFVTVDQIQEAFPNHYVHVVTKEDVSVNASPGTRYRHYAPKGEIRIIPYDDSKSMIANTEREINSLINAGKRKIAALCFEGKLPSIDAAVQLFNLGDDSVRAVAQLFDYLLACDCAQIDGIVIQLSDGTGVGATYNERVLRAAGQV